MKIHKTRRLNNKKVVDEILTSPELHWHLKSTTSSSVFITRNVHHFVDEFLLPGMCTSCNSFIVLLMQPLSNHLSMLIVHCGKMEKWKN
jgi:hypothetical protein